MIILVGETYIKFYICGVLLFNEHYTSINLHQLKSSFVQMLKFHSYCHGHEIKM